MTADTLCWAWWRTPDKAGHHRCMLGGDHLGLCECCCGARTADATRTVPKPLPPELAARLAANPAYRQALADAGSEPFDGPGIGGAAMIAAASERRKAARGELGLALRASRLARTLRETGTPADRRSVTGLRPA